MTTYAFPTLARRVPSDWTFGQRSNCRIHTPPLSGQVQTVELPGARWLCSQRYSNLLDPDPGLLEAFFAKLRGQANPYSRAPAWPSRSHMAVVQEESGGCRLDQPGGSCIGRRDCGFATFRGPLEPTCWGSRGSDSSGRGTPRVRSLGCL